MHRHASLRLMPAFVLFALVLAMLPGVAFAEPASASSDEGITALSADAQASASTDGYGDLDVDDQDAYGQDEPGIPAAPARNNIPMVTIFVEENSDVIGEASSNDWEHSYGTFDDLMSSTNHDVRVLGSVNIDVPEGYEGEFGSSYAPEGELKLDFMRGRGNSTWEAYKKPFKLKFEDKQEFFGMKPAKEWALMASAYDETLLDNRIASWIAIQMGLPYTPRMVPVDVVVVRVENGRELERIDMGSYCLSELVEVDANRLPIGKLKEGTVSDNPDDEENITGGYLLSLYHPAQDSSEPANNVFCLDSGPWLYGRGPEFADGELSEGRSKQHDYIYDYLRQVDQLVMGEDFSGTTYVDAKRHNEIDALMDLGSAADYWWTQVFSRNKDGFLTASTYLYKPRGDKLYWGPSWDFDQGFERGVEGWTYNRAFWLDTLRETDPRFVSMLKERWLDPENGLDAKMAAFTAPGGPLDAYVSEMRKSWEENDSVYPIKSHPFRERYEGDFDTIMASLRDWIDNRRAWINEHLDEIGVDYAEGDGPCEVSFTKSSDPAFICEGDFGCITYSASVEVPYELADAVKDGRMTFFVHADDEEGKQGKTRVVEVPFEKANVTTSDMNRTIATFTLPLSSIEMGQAIKSTFSYKADGRERSIEQEETMEEQAISCVSDEGDQTRVNYAKMFCDFGCCAYDFFAAHGNGNVKPENYRPMNGRYTEQLDHAAARAGIQEDLENRGAAKDFGQSRIKKVTMKLRFDSTATVEIDVQASDGTGDFDASANFKGKKYNSERISDTKRRIRISGLRAQDLGETIAVYGCAASNYNVSCSALSYADAVMEKSAYGQEGDDFMSALFNFYKAAKEIAG